MIKRAPSRTQRSKGVRVKQVVQICLLLGVCFWLIYQVKHSHGKKKEFDDKDTKASLKTHSDDEILKLGRKDLPQAREVAKNERHGDEEEDSVEEEENKREEKEMKAREREEEEEERDDMEGQEEAINHDEEHGDGDNKHEDEEQEEDKNEEETEESYGKLEEVEQEESKNEEIEDLRRGDGDDELDEQDQERTEGETDREDEFIDEEKEREEGDGDRETKGNEGEEKNSQVENENPIDDSDNEGVDRNVHVAREENYKADDASSAVSHENQIIISETEKATPGNSNENSGRNVLEEENKSNATDQKNMELKLGESEMADSTSNATITEEKDHGAGLYNSQEQPLLTANNTPAEERKEISSNPTGSSTELTGSSMQNGTDTKLNVNPTPAENATLDGATNIEATGLQTTRLEQATNSDMASNGHQFDSNSTIYTKNMDADAGPKDSVNNSSPAPLETFMKLTATADEGANSGSSGMSKTADTTQNETSNRNSESDGTNEISDSSTTKGNVDANTDSESGETIENSDSSSKNKIVEAAKEDPIDSSDTSIFQDENESLINLNTLPDIISEVDNREEAAAE